MASHFSGPEKIDSKNLKTEEKQREENIKISFSKTNSSSELSSNPLLTSSTTREANRTNKTLSTQKLKRAIPKEIKQTKKILRKGKKNTRPEKGDRLALASILLAGVSLLSFMIVQGLGILFGLTSLVLGIISLRNKTSLRGLAIVGIVVGSLSLLYLLAIAVFVVAFFLAF